MGRLTEHISPFIVMDILKEARQLPNAVHMEVGEPDLGPPPQVVEAYIRALKDQRFYYTPAKGLPELRERIAEHYLETYSVEVSPERIIITPGTSGAFLVVMALLSSPDKTILLQDPSYPCYKNFAYFLERQPILVPVGKEANYMLHPDDLKGHADRVSAVIVSSPSNPTGLVYDQKSLRALVEEADRLGLWFISDEIYHGLDYEDRATTALRFSDRAIVINGFSKYFCMPGFRLGWMILPQELVRKAEVVVQNIFIAANTPAQYAALEAFDYEYLQRVKETFRQRRDYLYSALKGLFEIDAPAEGAFYIWADISRYELRSMEFCQRLLRQKAVAITPGVDFGSHQTDNHVRFAYTRDIEELKEGVRRLKEFLGSFGV
jgi:aspartate/methionine/tyrosine aminotransferase